MGVIALLIALPPTIMFGVFMVRFLDQQRRDRQRKTYKLSFPSNLDSERVVAWLRSINGTLKPRSTFLSGLPTVAFETWASTAGIDHRLKVPWQHADFVIAQLRTHVPGLRYDEDYSRPHVHWTRAVEIGLTHSSRQLRIYDAADMAASLLAALQTLEVGEQLLIQWVITPAVPEHLPIHREAVSHHISYRLLTSGNLANRDEVNDRRGKLIEPNVMAVLRIGAVAGTEVRADHLIYRVKAALSSARSPSSRWVKRMVARSRLNDRIDGASAAVVFPIQLSVSELAGLVSWPLGDPLVSGLPAAMSRQLPVTENIPREGRIIGRSNVSGNERPIAMRFEDARRHVQVLGPTGVGKSVLLANMMKQDMVAGHGVILIENKGDLFNAALDYIPKDRMADVVILDVNDIHRPVGFNILQQGDPRIVIDELANLFEHMYDSKSVWTREVLYHGLRTLITDPKLTFIDLAALILPMTVEEAKWREALIRSLKDSELRAFWQRFLSQPKGAQERIVAPVMDRIWQLTARPELRNIIGQSESSFSMKELLEQNKILLVNLSNQPRDSASLFGTLVINSLWHAAKTAKIERPNFLYLDEFQDFLDLPVDPEDMLEKARGFGLGMVLAHQHLEQLPRGLRSAVMANARSKVVFQTSAQDAAEMARQFGSSVSPEDFMHLGRYEAVARLATEGSVSAPMTMATYAPARGFGKGDEVRNESRVEFGRHVADVEQEIRARRVPETAPKRARPKLQDGLGGEVAEA